jgi:magnesium transporter
MDSQVGERSILALSDAGPDVPAALIEGMDAIRREIEAGHPIWIDIEDPNPGQIAQIQSLFPFHPLAIEDVYHAMQRPKLEEYEQHIFLVAFGIRAEEGTRFTPIEVDFFLGSGHLVTFHEEPVAAIHDVMERCRKGRIPMERGSDYLLHAVLDGLVDSYFPLLEAFDKDMEGVERQLLGPPRSELLAEIFSTRRQLLDLRRLLIPHAEVLGHLAGREYPWVSPPVRAYFRDVYDHLMRISESADRYRELLNTAVETYLGQAAESTNRVMKILAALATLGLPLTVATSFYGMNFEHMPGIHHPLGVGILAGLLAAVEVLLFVLFRRKGWL